MVTRIRVQAKADVDDRTGVVVRVERDAAGLDLEMFAGLQDTHMHGIPRSEAKTLVRGMVPVAVVARTPVLPADPWLHDRPGLRGAETDTDDRAALLPDEENHTTAKLSARPAFRS